jgi:DNA repair exonuclease SbcCD ATPase subunit
LIDDITLLFTLLADSLGKVDFSKMLTSPKQFMNDLKEAFTSAKDNFYEIQKAERETAKQAKEDAEKLKKEQEKQMKLAELTLQNEQEAEKLRQSKLTDQEKLNELLAEEAKIKSEMEGLEEGSIGYLNKQNELLKLQQEIVKAKEKADRGTPTGTTKPKSTSDLSKLSPEELAAKEKELADELKEAPFGRNAEGRPLTALEKQRQQAAEGIGDDRERVADNINTMREWHAEQLRRKNMGLDTLAPPELLKPGEKVKPLVPEPKTEAEQLKEIHELMRDQGIVVKPIVARRGK